LAQLPTVPLLNVAWPHADLASRIVEPHLISVADSSCGTDRQAVVVIIVDTMIPMRGATFDLQPRFVKLGLVESLAPAIGGK